MGGEDSERDKDGKWRPPPQKADLKLWGILAFTVIGATATTFAVHQLRRTFDWVYTQVGRAQSAARKGTRGGSFRTAYQEEAWRRYNKRMQEEYEEELERVERIRRMQSVFNRERNKFRGGFENWKENDPNAHQYHQQYQRNDWYWKAESTFRNQRTNHQEPPKQSTRVYPLSHHYSVLGLSRSRATPYTEAEIKKAFREKAMEFHPDQNQVNKDVAEAKFKEVLLSYEAIKEERKDK
ncbi:hypothetical protein HID58_052743 [Brassica napus]|uniref:BnaC03g27990D protein n=3 Tax=Brassica TaxID=3705 RepID=A0A078H897_BRANA|nr:uncharacterized protein BNAC03G27990D [Brassica napus]KAH0890314.1 hypothetical protein HID58_052743 [Brassica napus]CAF1701999.1 unnamed protein product [Brassica napus]CDY34016.1 BnaC03g27990D [Brassica napus]